MLNDLAAHLVAFDRSAFHAINSGMESACCDILMPAFSFLGLGHIQLFSILGAAVIRASRLGQLPSPTRPTDLWQAIRARGHWITPLLVALAVSGLIAGIAKHTVPRQRPTFYYSNEHKVGRALDVSVHTIRGIRPLRIGGFPSGHTATSVALALVLTVLCRRYRRSTRLVALGWVIAALVGLSRIYMADHWPLDVAGGILVGLLSGAIALYITRPRTPGRSGEARA